MFSVKEKQYIAAKIEELLLSLNHPEMSKEKPMFNLHVDGAERWSWCDIKPNWTYDENNKPGINPWNEVVRDIVNKKEEVTDDDFCDDCKTYHKGPCLYDVDGSILE